MTQPEFLNEFLSLPVEAQRQVIDFIAFLRNRYAVVEIASQTGDADLANDSFIGMWCDRQELANSTAWVRAIRKNEWSQSNE